MEDYESYDLQEEDPYLIPGSTCLRNRLDITDTQRLSKAEAELTSVTLAELIAAPIEPTFDLTHLCKIHRHVFGDIYSWAGELRETEISKGAMLFLPYRLIPEVATDVFGQLHRENCLEGLSETQFARRAAYYLGKINMIHAFREGNGRTQRVFLNQLAEGSGYGFVWSSVSGAQMAQASRNARGSVPSYAALERLLRVCITRL